MAIQFVNRKAALGGIPISSSLSQVSDRAEWRTTGVATFASARSRRGDSITIDDSINRIMRRLIGQIGPVVSAAVNKHLAPVAENAFEKWPIASGLSKSQLFFEVEVSPDRQRLSAKIINRAEYAWAINRGRTVRELVFKPGARAAKQIQSDIAAGLIR